MKKEKCCKQKNKTVNKGFTLIEMLVVMLIIGILAAIALPQYQRVIDKTRFTTMMNIAKALALSNERYYMIHNEYYTNIRNLDITLEANSISVSGSFAYYDWGNCWVYYKRGVFCTNNTNLQNQIMVGYTFGDQSATNNKMLCMAKGNDQNSRYAKVCEGVGTYWTTSSCEILGTCMFYNIKL